MSVLDVIDVRSRFLEGDLLWTGYRTSFTSYVWQNGPSGTPSTTSPTSSRTSPQGLVTAGLGLLCGLTVVFAWLRGDTPLAGWAPIMLVGGLIMAALGVTGEHRWRINESAREWTNNVKEGLVQVYQFLGPSFDPTRPSRRPAPDGGGPSPSRSLGVSA